MVEWPCACCEFRPGACASPDSKPVILVKPQVLHTIWQFLIFICFIKLLEKFSVFTTEHFAVRKIFGWLLLNLRTFFRWLLILFMVMKRPHHVPAGDTMEACLPPVGSECFEESHWKIHLSNPNAWYNARHRVSAQQRWTGSLPGQLLLSLLVLA